MTIFKNTTSTGYGLHGGTRYVLERNQYHLMQWRMSFTTTTHCLQETLNICSGLFNHPIKSPKNSCCTALSTGVAQTCLCAVNSSISGSGARGNNPNHTNADGNPLPSSGINPTPLPQFVQKPLGTGPPERVSVSTYVLNTLSGSESLTLEAGRRMMLGGLPEKVRQLWQWHMWPFGLVKRSFWVRVTVIEPQRQEPVMPFSFSEEMS